jgi:4-hydroxybenzoate polyprenyltransferase
MNDLLDLRRDQMLAPERLLASGRVGPSQAAMFATASLILALLGAGLLGGQSVFVLVLLAAGLLFYNAMARFIPAIGLLMPGLLVAGLSMLSGWPPPVSWLPWSLFTVCVAVALVLHLVGDKRPRPSPRAIAGLTLEWFVVSVLLVVLPLQGDALAAQEEALGSGWLLWPAGAIAVLCVLLGQRLRHARSSPRVVDRMIRTVGVWCGLFSASWCMAIGAHGWAIAFGVATALAVAALGMLGELLSGDRAGVDWR